MRGNYTNTNEGLSFYLDPLHLRTICYDLPYVAIHRVLCTNWLSDVEVCTLIHTKDIT